jgi:hypothetical protein
MLGYLSLLSLHDLGYNREYDNKTLADRRCKWGCFPHFFEVINLMKPCGLFRQASSKSRFVLKASTIELVIVECTTLPSKYSSVPVLLVVALYHQFATTSKMTCKNFSVLILLFFLVRIWMCGIIGHHHSTDSSRFIILFQ